MQLRQRGLVRFLVPLWSGLALAAACAPVPHSAPVSARSPQAARAAARAPVPGAPAGATAFVNVAVVPMDTERVLANHTVLIEGGWITALGPSNKIKVPAGAARIDGRGQYLMPGLADMHVHLEHVTQDSIGLEHLLGHFVANGVTTIRDMTHLHPAPRNLQLKARAAAGTLLSPRLYTSGAWGPPQYTNDNDGQGTGKGPQPRLDSVAAYVAAYKALGYDHVKPYTERRPVFDSLLAAARRLGIPVAGHLPRPWTYKPPRDTTLSLEWALPSGAYRSVEHLMGFQYDYGEGPLNLARLDEAKLPARVAATTRAGVWSTPTLAFSAGHYRLDSAQWEGGRRTQEEDGQKIVRALHAAGAGLLLGSDLSGLSWATPSVVHHELAALVRLAGLSPYEALATGTRNVAQYFGTLDSTGTVTVGKRADLVLLHRNPLDDIRHTREQAGVMLGGRWLPREELDRILTVPAHAIKSGVSGAGLEWFFFHALRGLNPSRSKAQQTALKAPSEQARALADSLLARAPAAPAPDGERQRLRERMAEQFGAMRTILTPEQRESFDPVARVWLREQARQGARVAIPGVAPAS
jgi:hypothetical protein